MQTAYERFNRKVVRGNPDECWEWTGKLWKNGYGSFYVSGERTIGAHRAAWEFEHGPIPDGLELDHICHDSTTCDKGRDCPHRRCVNPAHLRLVTHAENMERASGWKKQNLKTHCKRGHEFTPENTSYESNGARICKTCRREWMRAIRGERTLPAARACEVCGTMFEPDRHPNATYCSGRCNTRAYRARQSSA